MSQALTGSGQAAADHAAGSESDGSPNSTRVAELIVEFGAEASGSVAHLLCDRHPESATAFVVVDRDGTASPLTFAELREESSRLAAGLANLGVGRGDRVAVLMARGRRLPVVLLAIWRLGAVHIPLFTAFAAPAVESRIAASGARVVIADADQRAKVANVAHAQILDAAEDLDQMISKVEPLREAVDVGPDGTFVQLYTSGTTGRPKGVAVPRRAIAGLVSYLEYGLDVSDDDLYWNGADPGWAYGLYYGIIAPLASGKGGLLTSAPFTPQGMADTIAAFGVTNFAGAPTMYRAMMQKGLTTGPLRRASSAGEPLTPDVTAWSTEALGCEVRDHYGQTEHGMVIGNCWHDGLREPVEPGCMGKPFPGFAAAVRDGQLLLDVAGSPLMWFDGYVGEPEKTAERFTEDGRWYITGDAARQEGDRFFFTSREDDVIIMAGYRIGPFDIESILTQHPAVNEAAVVGMPDAIRGEVLEAFVVLSDAEARRLGGDELGPGQASAEFTAELKDLVRSQYGAHAYPRTVHIVDELPKTPSGKIQRFVLRGKTR